MVTSHQSLMFLPPAHRFNVMHDLNDIQHLSHERPPALHTTLHRRIIIFFPLQLTAYSSCIARILNWRQQFRFLRSLGSFHRSFFQSYHSVSQGNFTFLVRVALAILKLELLRERERERQRKKCWNFWKEKLNVWMFVCWRVYQCITGRVWSYEITWQRYFNKNKLGWKFSTTTASTTYVCTTKRNTKKTNPLWNCVSIVSISVSVSMTRESRENCIFASSTIFK